MKDDANDRWHHKQPDAWLLTSGSDSESAKDDIFTFLVPLEEAVVEMEEAGEIHPDTLASILSRGFQSETFVQ